MARVFLFGNDVDTDQILPSQYLILPNIEDMKAHAFEGLAPPFAATVQPGDLLVGGANFGCGSSREQAPSVLKALGVSAVLADSFARIFFRNAINIGLPVLVCPGLSAAVQEGCEAQLDLAAGVVQAAGKSFSCTRLPAHMQNILENGGLIAWLNAKEGS